MEVVFIPPDKTFQADGTLKTSYYSLISPCWCYFEQYEQTNPCGWDTAGNTVHTFNCRKLVACTKSHQTG